MIGQGQAASEHEQGRAAPWDVSAGVCRGPGPTAIQLKC